MHAVLLPLTALAVLCLDVSPSRAAESPELQSTSAFEKAYAASFYEFDACGDGVAGRTYRVALVDRFQHCPFSADAKQRFQLRATAQRRKSAQILARLIEDNGGLPTRLQGMTRTCHEQMESPEYRQLRDRLNDFSTGRLGSEAVVPQPCDASDITP